MSRARVLAPSAREDEGGAESDGGQEFAPGTPQMNGAGFHGAAVRAVAQNGANGTAEMFTARKTLGARAGAQRPAAPAHGTVADDLAPERLEVGATSWRWEDLLKVGGAFLLSRVLVFAAAVLGDVFLPTAEGHWVADSNSAFLSYWAKWDSQWYVQIARSGYSYQPLQQSSVAFFPLYPLSVRLLAPLVGGNFVLAGFLLSNIYLFLALVFLYRLAALELGDRGGAARTVLYLAFFPTAFFLSAVYTESLFLLLSVSAIYFARRQHWLLAAAAGLLAAATRNLGVLLMLLVLWEWLRRHGWRITRIHRKATWRNLWTGVRADWPDLLVIAAIPLGLLLYLAFLQANFARPTAFVEVQAAWGRQNVGPVAVVMREVAALRDFSPTKGNLSRVVNLVAFLGVLALVPLIWRRLGEGYALYVLVLLLVPASSAMQSIIRYVLPMFPVFILLGAWGSRPPVDRAIFATFALLLGVLTTIYVNWIFVA